MPEIQSEPILGYQGCKVSPDVSPRINGDASSNNRLNIDKDDVAKGLGRLVLTVVELVRELLERQAIRRMEGGSLTDEEVDNLGNTFEKLNEKISELKRFFGIEGEELNIDLGPLGRLL